MVGILASLGLDRQRLRGLWMHRAISISALLLFCACASLGGKKHFGAGQRAEQQGDLEAALVEYRAAVEAQPENADYRAGLERAQKAAAERRAQLARDAESREDWSGAVGHWRDALTFLPDSAELKARHELAGLHTKRSDPLEYFAATERLAQALPGDPTAAAALEQARNDAFHYYAKLAETYFDAGSFTDAFQSFERARKVKPDDASFKGLKYRISRARHFEALGDQKLKSGDALSAFRAYEEAASFADLPGLEAKLTRARRGAGSLIEQLEQARAFERLQKWEDAAELYTLIRDRSDAPPEIADAARRARQMSAKLRADRATTFAAQGQADQASAAFALALEHTDAAQGTLGLLRDGLLAVEGGQAGEALAKFRQAKTSSPDLPVTDAAFKVVSVRAKVELEAAKAQAQKDPAEAMVRVQRLLPFREDLPGYDQVRSQLVKRAFATLLERAEVRAGEGKGREAAELLATALQIAQVPPALGEPFGAGQKALAAGDYRGAREAFMRALKADKRSRLAQSGSKISTQLWASQLRREAAEAERAEDPLRAASAYRELLVLSPEDHSAEEGLAALRPALVDRSLAAAEAHRAASRPGSAYVYYRRVLELDPTNDRASDAITQLTASFDLKNEATGWVSPSRRGDRLGDACAGAEVTFRERMILYLTRTRNLGAEFLGNEPTKEVDQKKRPPPSVELLSALEHCAVNDTGGSVAASIQVRLGGRPVFTERVAASFDPKALPKDEAGEGIDAAAVLDQLLKEAAKQVSAALAKNAGALADWRVKEAKARIDAGDNEGIAQSYAVLALSQQKLLSNREREVLRELEQQLLVRLR